MKTLITAEKLGTRFFMTAEGLATDIQSNASLFRWSYDAQCAADAANADPAWQGFKWQARQVLSDGSLVLWPKPITSHDKNASFTTLAATERGQNALAREYATIRVGRWQSLSFVPKVSKP